MISIGGWSSGFGGRTRLMGKPAADGKTGYSLLTPWGPLYPGLAGLTLGTTLSRISLAGCVANPRMPTFDTGDHGARCALSASAAERLILFLHVPN